MPLLRSMPQALGANAFPSGSRSWFYVALFAFASVMLIVVSAEQSNSMCVITSDTLGLQCWGGNNFGQLGIGSTSTMTSPTNVIGLDSGVLMVSLAYHACALVTPGLLKCWGKNDYGQLGIGTSINMNTPTVVTALGNTVAFVAVSEKHTCAIVTGLAVKCWGNNNRGQLGIGSSTDKSTPTDVVSQDKFAAVSLGVDHTCGITTDGAIKCWGCNDGGQLGNGNTISQSTPVSAIGISSPALQIACSFWSCAIFSGGDLKCWGGNHLGYLGTGDLISRNTPVTVFGLGSGVVRVTTGWFFTCAIVSGNGLKCWGHDGYTYQENGLLGMGTHAGKCNAEQQHVYCESTPKDVQGLNSGVIGVASGQMHTCVILIGNSVKCWGGGGGGTAFDLESTAPRGVPTTVVGLSARALWTSAPISPLQLQLAINSTDRIAGKPSVPITLAFTPTTLLPSGGTVTLTYPTGFFAPSVTPNNVTAGGSNVAGLTAAFGATTATSVVMTMSGALISVASVFTVTITGITMGTVTSGATGVTVQTSSDTVASTAVASGSILGRVASVSFTIASTDRISGKTSIPVTLAFTPTTLLPSGGTLILTYPTGFFASGVAPQMLASTVPSLQIVASSTTASSVLITVGPPFFLAASVPFTVTLTGRPVARVVCCFVYSLHVLMSAEHCLLRIAMLSVFSPSSSSDIC